jgi:hypothetical protein
MRSYIHTHPLKYFIIAISINILKALPRNSDACYNYTLGCGTNTQRILNNEVRCVVHEDRSTHTVQHIRSGQYCRRGASPILLLFSTLFPLLLFTFFSPFLFALTSLTFFFAFSSLFFFPSLFNLPYHF